MAPPPMDQQLPPQQWTVMPTPQPQYYQAPPAPPMWNQQHTQVPPPVPQPVPQQPQPQYQAPAPVLPSQMQYQAPAPAPAMVPQPAPTDEIRTLWIGDLQYWMEENYLYGCFVHTGEVVSVKVIRNKQTGQSEGYGFMEFVSRSAADRILQTYNGQVMPNTEQAFRLNWATCGAGERRGDGADYTIFVGDLAADVTDYLLQETFMTHYSSVKGAKVVTDRLTGRSKGYGFVKFGDLSEQTRAMTEMNGIYCSTRPMRIGPAANKNTVGTQQQFPTNGMWLSIVSCSYRPIRICLAVDRYADLSLPGGTAKIDRRQSISAAGDRLREKSTVGGRLRKKKGRGRRRRGKEERRRKGEEIPCPRVLAARGSPASLFSPCAEKRNVSRAGREIEVTLP
ncbi:hypothetical protein BHM03_00043079, partial [Ensete ventricosum]